MSADNGVYILETLKDDGLEYRVAHLQAVENYQWGTCPIHGTDIHFGNDGRLGCESCPRDCSDNPDDHIINAREMWKHSPVFKTLHEALEYAWDLYTDLEVCEYGIGFITIARVF